MKFFCSAFPLIYPFHATGLFKRSGNESVKGVALRGSLKKMCLKISQNLQGKTCVEPCLYFAFFKVAGLRVVTL